MISVLDSGNVKNLESSTFEGKKDLKIPSQRGRNIMGKDDFLKLFLAQLKNQDPLQPRDSHELASQLAQFTSLEKLENIDQGIHQMSSSKEKKADYKALGLMGKKVFGDLSKINYSGKEISFQYDLLDKAHKVEVAILNGANEAERDWVFTEQAKGFHQFNWDGLKEDGSQMASGNYTLQVKAYNQEGEKVESRTSFEGVVTGVNFTKEGTLLLIGEKAVKLSDVDKIMPGNLVEERSKNPLNQKTDLLAEKVKK